MGDSKQHMISRLEMEKRALTERLNAAERRASKLGEEVLRLTAALEASQTLQHIGYEGWQAERREREAMEAQIETLRIQLRTQPVDAEFEVDHESC